MVFKPAYLEINPHALDPKDISKGLDFSRVCSWVEKYKGDARYSGHFGSSSLIKTASAPAASTAFSGRSILMPQVDTYALGVEALRNACVAENNPRQPKVVIDGRELYRPNTFLENIEARITDFNTLTNPDGTPRSMEERLRYFSTWLDSCCGVAYQAKTTKLKLGLQCPQLIGIVKDFADRFLPVDYASFQGIELDSNNKTFARDARMTLLEGKTDVYTEYLQVLKAAKGKEVIPGFWVQQNTGVDQLQAAYVNLLGNYSIANGYNLLNNLGRFLRRSP